MTWQLWLSLAAICALGATSPGPSLAVVLRNTLRGGRPAGLITAIAHGVGIGTYAFAVALGLGVLVGQSTLAFKIIQYAGAAFLAYLGVRSLMSGGVAEQSRARGQAMAISAYRAARDGFLIAFLNPKIAVWFLALFSQFVKPETALSTKFGMAGLAAGIDTVWYVLVALALSHTRVLPILQRNAVWLDRVFGVILIALAVRVVMF